MRSSNGSQDLLSRAPEYFYFIDKGPEHIYKGKTRLLLQRAKELLGACQATNQRQEELTLSIEVRQECRGINKRIQAFLKKAFASVAFFVDGERDKLLSVLDSLDCLPQASKHAQYSQAQCLRQHTFERKRSSVQKYHVPSPAFGVSFYCCYQWVP
jgi:hypothetical protein